MVYKAVLKLVKDELGRRKAAREGERQAKLNTNQTPSIYENVELGKPAVLPRPPAVGFIF